MRPPRMAVLLLLVAASTLILCRSLLSTAHPGLSAHPAEVRPSSKSLFGFFYYNTPFSLFPPNAAISLTDDNSTSFAARPAAFGPKLAATGLSGQLWVGSGFADDSLDGSGELGCSDVPGWTGGNTITMVASKPLDLLDSPRSPPGPRIKSNPHSRRAQLGADVEMENRSRAPSPSSDKGQITDAHLNTQHSGSLHRREGQPSSHADIQSIQETAEIQGKVVLLMRGGCGFLEKVMWAQRRGAIAVIIGDNQKGGPLIQMFAQGGEVENVTVPSVFTARTTAHLLSSLTQPGTFLQDSVDDNGRHLLRFQQGPKSRQEETKRAPVAVKTSSPTSKTKRSIKAAHGSSPALLAARRRWLPSLLLWGPSRRSVPDTSRPPRSGRLDWVVVDDWSDERDKAIAEGVRAKKPNPVEDDFVIGIQDWRDPDLVDRPPSGPDKGASSPDPHPGPGKGTVGSVDGPEGGSITPSSGEYNAEGAGPKDDRDAAARTSPAGPAAVGGKGRGGIMSKIFGDEEASDSDPGESPGSSPNVYDHSTETAVLGDQHHDLASGEGLWVTITPTSSTSPFFDTLLVLVISPLITLTVVYTLLILRARIRRRRWRAPKSVVDRLPVRTYYTVAASPGLPSRLPSPSGAGPRTPLLQRSPSTSRPRSRTTTGVMESENFFVPSPSTSTPQPALDRRAHSEGEKGSGGCSAEWRRQMGRQVECVVCLEEYIDGVSRVMSLPCGHEFHADCITPWLTTRRRTCPICKGDVVRSLARSSRREGPGYEAYRDESEEDDGTAEPSSSRSANRSVDMERGTMAAASLTGRREGWLFGLLWNRFGVRSRGGHESPSPAERVR